MIDYSCGKFSDRSFSRFGSITLTDAHKRYTPATLIGVSKAVDEIQCTKVMEKVECWRDVRSSIEAEHKPS